MAPQKLPAIKLHIGIRLLAMAAARIEYTRQGAQAAIMAVARILQTAATARPVRICLYWCAVILVNPYTLALYHQMTPVGITLLQL